MPRKRLKTNGTGNLIVGNDEKPGTQTGSNNLMVGSEQSYTAYGSILGGQLNTASGPFSVAFGVGNAATGPDSSIAGGKQNIASGEASSVSGGIVGTASGLVSWLGGGTVQHGQRRIFLREWG